MQNAKLRQFADKIDYKMKVNSDALQKLIEAGNPERRIKPVKITHDSTICKYYPYDHSECSAAALSLSLIFFSRLLAC